MATPGVFTPYSTVSGFVSAGPSWVPDLEKDRIASYQTYEEIYWNHPTSFKLVARGTEVDLPIYLPSGRIIVDTMHRYMGRRLNVSTIPAPGVTAGTEQEVAAAWLNDWMARETFKSLFASSKLYGIMRGDWVFHVVADPNKIAGRRVSVRAVDPAAYFPVYDDDDLDKLIKVHLAEEFVDDQGKSWIRRQTYEYADDGVTVLSSLGVYEMDKWFAPNSPATAILAPPTPLPSQITSFPVYLIKNFDQPGNPYGSSEMRGLERIMAGMNQSITDEDLALALEGLGVYTTDGAGPVDENGEETDWVIGPGRVIENAAGFKRIQGVGSVAPFTEHIGTLWRFLRMAGGTPDAALGDIDVTVAESGVALKMKLGPILSRAEEKELLAADKLTQFFFDLRSWFAAYESMNFENTRWVPSFGDPLPQNQQAEVDLLSTLVTDKIISTQTARERLVKLGWDIPADEDERLKGEASASAATADPFGARLGAESGEDTSEG